MHSFSFALKIGLMTERKADLERRINLLQGEREGLSSTLDESADRIIMLEKQSREQDSLVSNFNLTTPQLPHSRNRYIISSHLIILVGECGNVLRRNKDVVVPS